MFQKKFCQVIQLLNQKMKKKKEKDQLLIQIMNNKFKKIKQRFKNRNNRPMMKIIQMNQNEIFF